MKSMRVNRSLQRLMAIGISLSMTGASFVLPLSTNAYAATSNDSAEVSLAAQIVSLSSKAHDGGLGQQLAKPVLAVLTDPTFSWNQVMFGTDQLNLLQGILSRNLSPALQQLVTLQDTTTSQAMSTIQAFITGMQQINGSLPASDVINFLQTIVNGAPTEMLYLASQPKNVATFEADLHSDFTLYVKTSSQAVQQVFAQATLPSSGGGTSGGGTSGGSTSGGSTSGGSTSSGIHEFTAVGGTFRISLPGISGTIEIQIPSGAVASKGTFTLVTVSTPPTSIWPRGTKPILALSLTFHQRFVKPYFISLLQASLQTTSLLYAQHGNVLIPLPFVQASSGKLAAFLHGSANLVVFRAPTVSAPRFPKPMPKVSSSQRLIWVDGKREATLPSKVIDHTTYMPMQNLSALFLREGIHSYWDGTTWNFVFPRSFPIALNNYSLSHGGHFILAIDGLPIMATQMTMVTMKNGRKEVFVPITSMMQLLSKTFVSSAWNGTTWSMNFPH